MGSPFCVFILNSLIRVIVFFPGIFFLAHPEHVFANATAQIAESPISQSFKQSTITALTKDRDGFLWVGTQHGLYKFNGSSIIEFNTDLGNDRKIPASDIRGLVEDAHGRIVVATFGGGVLRSNLGKTFFSEVEEDSNAKTLYPKLMHRSALNEIWIVTENGLWLLDSERESLSKIYNVQNEIATDKEIHSITTDTSGNVYFASSKKIFKLERDREAQPTIIFESDAFSTREKFSEIQFSGANRMYIGTESGSVFAINLTTHLVVASTKIQNSSSVSIKKLIFRDDILWIGTNRGLFQANAGLSLVRTYRQDNSGLTNDHIVTLLADLNFIWVGTYGGLNTLSFQPFHTLNEQNSRVFNDILAFEQDINGRLWVGTFNGLYLFDENLNLHRRYPDKKDSSALNDQRVMTISANNRQLWIGYRKGGIQVLDLDSLKLTSPKISDHNQWEVTKILHTGDGRSWVATFNHGLYSFLNGKAKSFLSEGILLEKRVTTLLPTQIGLLAGSEYEIFIYDETREKFSHLKLEYSNITRQPHIFSIAEHRDGSIWIGTKDQGIFIWSKEDQDKSTLRAMKIVGNVTTTPSTIYGIQFDDMGNAWCSTESGIYKFDPNGFVLEHYSASNGLQGNDFNFGASYKDSTGSLLFGGSNGYIRFDPKIIESKGEPPSMLMLGVAVSENSFSHFFEAARLKKLELTYKAHYVSFEFAVLDFLDPNKNQYRYMLEGFDHSWIENGTRNTATYTNLPAGDYVLRVQGANSSGVWNREGISLNVHVTPPPWFTWWAFCFYGVILLFFSWLGKRAYDSYAIERMATQKALLMHEEAERADDELQEQLEIQDDLVKSVYQHNVATLGLIGDFISTQSGVASDWRVREDAGSNVKRVHALVALEECVYHQNESLLADMHKYADIIISRLLKESTHGPESITSINEVSAQPIPLQLASPLAIVLYELVDNAITHAFGESPANNYLHIVLNAETPGNAETLYRLTVDDNGVGLPENFDPLEISSSGLAIVKSMSDRLAGSLGFAVQQGTRVTLTFPSAVRP
jgi:ligand-binding sensor domain-containing protein/two-component sensor histidine kinase